MSTNKLAQVIRKIVREEVRKEVRTVLNEQKTKSVPVKEFKSGLQHALGLQDSIERRARKPKKQVKYTKNKMLNNILNETGEYPTMDKQLTSKDAHTFDRNSLAAKMGYGDMKSSGTPTLEEMVPKVDTRGVSNQGVQVDASVAKALTRDYSELVKKFKK
jgi:hypothetical protein